jgi:hypothetical protein
MSRAKKDEEQGATVPGDRRPRRERKRYEFVLEAAQSVAHAQESVGNESILMRRRVRQVDGWAEVPCVTGDTMRHGMREAAAWALVDAAGIGELSAGAQRLLFSGGMVTGKGDASVVNLDRYRELCELVPSMGIFGGCCDNRVIPGRLVVEEAQLICLETERYVPAWAVDLARARYGDLDSCRAHVEEVQRVRMDPLLDPQKRKLLSASAQVDVNRRLASSEQAHGDGDARGAEEAKSSMMPRRHERLAQGSLLAWACEATCWGELEVDALNVAVCAFLADARVGGKKGTGHGLLRVVAGQGVALPRPVDVTYPLDALAVDVKVGEVFRAHVAERAERIRSFLANVNA